MVGIREYKTIIKRYNTLVLFFLVFFCFFLLILSSVFMGTKLRTTLGIEEFYLKEVRPLFVHYYNLFISIDEIVISQLTTKTVDPAFIDLPIFQIYIKEDNLDALNADLPQSGEEYVPGMLVFENTTYDVKLRYRGDGVGHWMMPKKSWRVRLKENRLLFDTDMFNLINPKFTSHFTEAIKFSLAEDLGILAPRNFPAAVFLNGNYIGVYQFQDQLHETFLRLNKKLPGDIYYGDMPFENTSFRLFSHPEDWDIHEVYDGNIDRANASLVFFISHVKEDDPEEFYSFFIRHLGEDYLRFSALSTLLGSAGPDNRHNHKFYLNPSSGAFEPIEWDATFFSPVNRSISHSQHDLDSQMYLHPALVYQRNRILFTFLDPAIEVSLLQEIEQQADAIHYEIYHDAYKKPGAGLPAWSLTNSQWEDHVASLPNDVSARFSFLRNALEDSNVTIYIIYDAKEPYRKYIVFDVTGVSPIIIDNIELSDWSDTTLCPSIYKDTNFNYKAEPSELLSKDCDANLSSLSSFIDTPLYPGFKEVQETGPNHFEFVPGELRYVFIVEYPETNPESIESSAQISQILVHSLTNAITKKEIIPAMLSLSSLADLPQAQETISFHPWITEQRKGETILWSDTIVLKEDVLVAPQDTLKIMPGTTIYVGGNVSLFVYGNIIANGTATKKIQFVPLDDVPWGSIALQGSQYSFFSYTDFIGGSGTMYELVHYSGMVSVYNSNATFSNCTLSHNKKEDDMLNAKNAYIHVSYCVFEESVSDAIDLDFTEGVIEDSVFISPHGDAIDLMGSSPTIQENYIIAAGDKGISIGEESSPFVVHNRIELSNVSIAIKDKSNPFIFNNTLLNNTIAISAYQKNWRYAYGGRGVLQDNEYCQNQKIFYVDNASLLTIRTDKGTLYCTADACENDCV